MRQYFNFMLVPDAGFIVIGKPRPTPDDDIDDFILTGPQTTTISTPGKNRITSKFLHFCQPVGRAETRSFVEQEV